MVPQVAQVLRALQVCYTGWGCSLLVDSYLLQQTLLLSLLDRDLFAKTWHSACMAASAGT